MHNFNKLALITSMFLYGTTAFAESTAQNDQLMNEVNKQAEKLMEQYQIPGMAFGVTIDGKASYFNYGLANKKANQPVTPNTIFELGSISKTFVATLTTYAQLQNKLSLSDTVSSHIPELKSSVIGDTTLLQLATYTAGGLPLQFPDSVTNKSMLEYYRNWQPKFAQDTKRQYSNPSIGLVGYIAALSMDDTYTNLIEKNVLKKLGMNNSFVNVPESKMNQYAFGYNSKGEAIRVNPGVLDAEAYGVKTTSSDMIRYIEANMGEIPLDVNMQTALNNTKMGYYQASKFVQGLAWEMYQLPVSLDVLLQGNSSDTIINAKQAYWFNEPKTMPKNVWINKTGSTGGFGAYIAYIPEKKVGIIILANKSYPNSERVKAAYDILNAAMKKGEQ